MLETLYDIDSCKLLIPTKFLKYLHSQLRSDVSFERKRKNQDDIANYVQNFYKNELNNLNKELYINVDKSGLSGSTIGRVFKPLSNKWVNSSKNKYSVKYELLDLLCFITYKETLAQYFSNLKHDMGVETIYSIDIPLYAKQEIEKYLNINKDNKIKKIKTPHLNQSNDVNKFKIKPFDSSKDNFNILILPFRNPENNNEITDLGNNINFRLIEKNNDLDLQIEYIPFIKDYLTYDKARDIGAKYKASMVIWGNDSKQMDSKNHIICFHYVVLIKDVITNIDYYKNKTKPIITDNLMRLTEGDFQLEIDAFIYWILAEKFYFKKEYKKALNTYRKIQASKSGELSNCKAECYYNLKQYYKAKYFFKKAVYFKPNEERYNFSYAFLLYDKFHDYNRANYYFKKVIQINPNNYEVLAILGDLNFNIFKDYSAAKKYYKKTLELKQNIGVVHNNYANLLYEHFEDSKSARKHYEIALALKNDDPKFNFNYAVFLLRISESLEIAKKHFEIAIKFDPNNFKYHHFYANLLGVHFGDFNGAKEHYEISLKLNPYYSRSHMEYSSLIGKHFNDKENSSMHYDLGVFFLKKYPSPRWNRITTLYFIFRFLEKSLVLFINKIKIIFKK